ncbi:MAG: hypothetical protein V5A72_02970 [Candidatus Nanohaloarchaea archaeon]
MTASLLILIAQSSILQLGQHTYRQNTVQSFNSLNSEISNICRQAPGSRTSTEMTMQNVKAVFTSENKKEAPAESSIFITNSRTSKGENVCMSFKEQHHECIQKGCPVNMTWMGEPMEDSDPYILGKDSGFNYHIKISKKRNGNVRVDGNIAP